ncbi:AAA-ATPase ASD, mitochondrial-like [Olea europaea subsp. europaea]|uniref:AAA-ATPase ASD, mitochondrial-like n=1 Tax=Olea europaea subsp. europaea TaxID=158383 RepID=A0A8S0RTJ7_OLEEU|nr:AAA-ATPase ASD, mitochondrial-like [Olea europaea subsp. europaea]
MLFTITEMMTGAGSAIAGLMVAYAMFQNYFPYDLRKPLKRYSHRIMNFFYPYIVITFPEFQGDGFERSKAFAAIERYLNKNSSKQAKHLQANVVQDSQAIVLSMADNEEVTDEFQGIKLWWASDHVVPDRQSISFYPREDANRYFTLTVHKKYRDVITNSYLKHVLDEGKEITIKERQRKLYTNNKSDNWYGYKRTKWSHVIFEHPASFDTLAMDPNKKEEIMKDLIRFTEAKDYYAKIGKAWKRGYLLYGPPGTGKSTMIAAMANLLKYDIYDLELTAVKDNTELRKLLIDTSSKSILVIEDIDCSLDLTGQREKKEKTDDEKKEEKDKDPVKAEMKKRDQSDQSSQVTLSGLLNFIDGLWSACGGERIIVFTTNYVDKLDPALIRRGRMDKHIELSYCSFEAFKVLAKNYLDIKSHHLFGRIDILLQETKMTPADVAENLMPKSTEEDGEACLVRLIQALEEAKVKAEEEAKKKAEEEAKAKAEEEAKAKAEEEEKLKAEKEKEENGKEGVEVNEEVKENGKDDKHSATNGVKENGDVSH